MSTSGNGAASGSGSRWASEPFRVFFPLGLFAGIAGVMLWPLFFWHVWPVWPGIAHPRLMMCGFGGAFVTGFLGTAWPRFLESRHLRPVEVLLLAGLLLSACVNWMHGNLQTGDLLFSAELLCLLIILSLRLHRAAGHPPPGFLLAFLSVAVAAVVMLWWGIAPESLTPWSFVFTRLMIWQGFLLLPLMGVGSYLLPRFFPGGGRHPGNAPAGAEEAALPYLKASARRRKAGVFLPAAMVVASFALEASARITAGNMLRAFAVLVWMGVAAPALLTGKSRSTRAFVLRMALAGLILSFIARALWPAWPVAMEHFLFLIGFGLPMLIIADRVALGHNDLMESMPARSVFWRWIFWLVVIGAATRVTADIVPNVMMSHYIYAALLWAGVSLAWWIYHRRQSHRAPPQ